MKTVKISIDPENPASLPEGRVDFNRLDSTNEQDIAEQQHMDETNAILDIEGRARYSPRS
ncbi:hypothetical protein [Methylobacter tundripaludum]|uniref:Uncharacterized protein n=1 Tax=Methylobacter tundripaludum (strain ATCC BAA-1195 / DSM 17260 / SV96) TaxID=697282 RepID=G3IU73_METTV|nr:hypothetical protein [Methylobacter tundripaludum]EGW22671.1 hypothetical protein Mettu_1495 [Methylobacter tundripaludum SV96]